MYPESKLSSSGVIFGPSINLNGSIGELYGDPDASCEGYIDIEGKEGYYYIADNPARVTLYNFNKQVSYVEFSYICKDDYIRSEFPITEACKITLVEQDTGKPVDFYLAAISYKVRSNQPVSAEEIELSSYELNLDYKNHDEVINIYPRFNNECSIIDNSNWLHIVDEDSDESKIKISIDDNWSTSSRRSQIEVNIIDYRYYLSRSWNIILKSFIVNVIQEPVHVSLSDTLIRFGSGRGSKVIHIYPSELSPSSITVLSGSWVSVTSSIGQIMVSVDSNIPEDEDETSYFRTAQLNFDVEKDGVIIDRLSVNIEQESGNDEGSPDDPDIYPDPADIPYISEFNRLLKSFGKSRVTEEGTPTTYSYIKTAIDDATVEYSRGTLFTVANNLEIKNYRGSNNQYEDLAKTSMYSWLLAMCLSELVPSSSTTSSKLNNQTQLYQKAYELGGGKYIPLYGSYTPKGDVMLARLVASVVYSKNRSLYSFSEMDAMRDEMKGTTINLDDWSTLGYVNVNNVGYNIATNEIFPPAPGPFISPSSSDRKYPQEQDASLFYSKGTQPFWYSQNYKVDVEIDTEVYNNYSLDGVNSNLSKTVQAVADDSESPKFRLGNETYYKYSKNGSTTVNTTVDGVTYTNSVSNPRFTFRPGSPDDYDGYFVGTFNQDVTGKDLSSKITDSNSNYTAIYNFMYGVRRAGQNVRSQLYDAQAGRGRPAHGTTPDSPRVSPAESIGTNEYDRNWLDDASIEKITGSGTKEYNNGGTTGWYVDLNGNGVINGDDPIYRPNEQVTYISSIYPSPRESYSYPSGHSAGLLSNALFLTQILPSKYTDLFRAAYDSSLSRLIVRSHWNSDIIYGRVIGTMGVPLINAVSQFRTVYNNAYTEITGETPPEPTPVGNGIQFVITNHSGKEARYSGKVILNVSKSPTNWSGSTQVNANIHAPQSGDSWDRNDIIIPNGGTYTSPVITTISGITQPSTNFFDGTWYFMNTDDPNNVYQHSIKLYTRIWSRSRNDYSGSDNMCWPVPLQNTKIERGKSYNLELISQNYNSSAYLASDSTTKTSVPVEYSYAILAEGKTSLAEE